MLTDNTFLFDQKEIMAITPTPHESKPAALISKGKNSEAPPAAKVPPLSISNTTASVPESAPIEKHLPAKKPLVGASLVKTTTKKPLHEKNFAKLTELIEKYGESIVSNLPIDMETDKELLKMQAWAIRTIRNAESGQEIEHMPEIKAFYQKYLCHL